MAAKIVVTLSPDLDVIAPDQAVKAMAESIALLSTVQDVPARKFVLTIECQFTEADGIRDDIHAALSRRPIGIEATTKTTTEEHVERKKAAVVTPMDKAGWN
jgi:hypothetical protein